MLQCFLNVLSLLEGCLDLILSLSPSVKIQIVGGKYMLKTKVAAIFPLSYYFSLFFFSNSYCNFCSHIRVFSESEGDRFK